jgi:FkbM family methyltransferase
MNALNLPLAPAPIAGYWHYLHQVCPTLDIQTLSTLSRDLAAINWDEPESALDLNNFAVLALIEAEQTEDPALRSMHLEMALEALEQAITLQPSHPLCFAHFALVRHLIGEDVEAIQLAFPLLMELLQPAFQGSAPLPLGLVYLPKQTVHLSTLLQAHEGHSQALLLTVEVLWRSQMVFYSSGGLRFLQLAVQVLPASALLHRQLGLAKLINHQWEGLWDLQRASQLAPDAATLQALYLTYRELQSQEIAQFWLEKARSCAGDALVNPSAAEWQWATLPMDSPFTYVPTADAVLLAVDPSFRSIVTSVLLAEGDWFEAEMEFWRQQIQPGMTVIDVGANVGVYTFSASRQVGPSGRVLAVEPFSSCVRCLEETRRVNELNWVTVCAGAASDRPGTARLSLHSSSELNEVVREEASDRASDQSQLEQGHPEQGNFEEIRCFTLNDLAAEHQLQRIDWLKIDAEGHETQVLAGSDRLLSQFAPGILYENIAGSSGSNTPVAELLQARGYQLFRYQPYLGTLIPIQAIEELQGKLNIIALPPDHPLLPG